MELPSARVKPKLKKLKKSSLEKVLLFSYISVKMELSCSNIKKMYIFSKESFFHISGNGNQKIQYISGNGTFLYFKKWNFLARK